MNNLGLETYAKEIRDRRERGEIPVLPDSSLCSIVRDEMMNPAGGIIDFVFTTVPFVQEAVIVDTGSIDGTLEVLRLMEQWFPHLTVYERPFDGYASSRNYSLDQVGTRRALVLDADERILSSDFAKLVARDNELYEVKGFKFEFEDYFPTRQLAIVGNAHNPRLFDVEGVRYVNYSGGLGECPVMGGNLLQSVEGYFANPQISILHFRPSEVALDIKVEEWYEGVILKGKALAPSQTRSSALWKEYNPNRERLREAI